MIFWMELLPIWHRNVQGTRKTLKTAAASTCSCWEWGITAIGFNEPDTPFESLTHIVELTESTIKANSRFFDSEEEVPRKALTMGIKTIMHAKDYLLRQRGGKSRSSTAGSARAYYAQGSRFRSAIASQPVCIPGP